MCGIGGIWDFTGGAPDETAVRRLLGALEHRGPDGHGIWQRGPLALVHTRLSIIDPGGSPQPMTSADGAVVILNGEILNYLKLRRQLDYPYRTDGDTETVLAAHRHYGDAAPQMLRGQFAYALYEPDRLLLVRDRLGILPLYWYHDGRRLIFGSEIATVLAVLGTPPELNHDALDGYLAGRAVPSPDTLLSGIRKLRPGHRLEVTADGGWVEEPFWSAGGRSISEQIAPVEAIDRLDDLLDAAVQRALIADVPVGAYLSGGVDSSLIAARAAAAAGPGMHTYCAEFGDPRTDESPHARAVAGLLGTTHHTVAVRPDDFENLWGVLSLRRGAPLSEPADIAVFRLAEAARDDVKVVLSGEGSDELFAGYPKHLMAAATAYAGAVPAGLRTPLLTAVERRLSSRGRRLGVALRALAEPTASDRRHGWFAPFTSTERARLLGRAGATSAAAHTRARPLRAMLLEDLHTWLPDNLLERGDRMTMAAGVELRPPFLDEDVVEFSLRLPERLLVHKGTTKWLVKQVARRHLPDQIVDRRKSGFTVPLDVWFRHGLEGLTHDLVQSSSSVTRSHLDPSVVTALLDSHRQGRDESIRIWTLASLEMWQHSLREAGRGAPSLVRLGPIANHRRIRIA